MIVLFYIYVRGDYVLMDNRMNGYEPYARGGDGYPAEPYGRGGAPEPSYGQNRNAYPNEDYGRRAYPADPYAGGGAAQPSYRQPGNAYPDQAYGRDAYPDDAYYNRAYPDDGYAENAYPADPYERGAYADEAYDRAEAEEPKQFAFKVRGLTKDYDGHVVLNNISFDIPAGKIVGLLGPNGCGKTTLLKILTGLIHDYTGVVKVGGKSIGITSKSHVAYLPDSTYFPGRFRTIDCINYYADFFADFDKMKAIQFAGDFGLDLNQRVKTMSKGMQEKLQLLVVMSRSADIYVLDEPLGGVDPAARSVILDIIMSNYKENSTVILSTHLVNDLEQSFDHVLMLGKGSVLVNTGISTLRATGKTVEEIFKEVIGDAWEVD